MSERNKRNVVKWNFIFYIFEFVYLITIGFLLIPLYLKFIPKDLYGYWLASGNILQLITVINPGFSDVIQQRISYNYGIKNMDKIGSYSCVGIFLTFLFSVIIMIIGFFAFLYLDVIFNDIPLSYIPELKRAFLLMLIGSVLLINYYSLGAIDYAIMSSKSIGGINLISNFFALFVTIIMLLKGYGIVSLGTAAVVRGFSFVLGSSIYTYYRFRIECICLKFDMVLFKEIFSLLGYNILGKVSSSITNQLNSFLSTKLVSPLASANLKFTQTVPEFGKIVIMRILNSVNPVLPNLYAEKGINGIKPYLEYLITIMLWGIGFISVGFSLLNKYFIVMWIGPNNYSGDLINILIIISISISILSWFFSQMLFSFGDIKKNNIVLFIQSFIYLVLAIFFTTKFEVAGLLFASILCQAAGFIIYFLRRYFFIMKFSDLERKKLLCEILFTIFSSVLSYGITSIILINKYSWLVFVFNVLICTLMYLTILMLSKNNRVIFKLLIHKINSKYC